MLREAILRSIAENKTIRKKKPKTNNQVEQNEMDSYANINRYDRTPMNIESHSPSKAYIPTVLMPNSDAARLILVAISPRFAAIILRNGCSETLTLLRGAIDG